ncbi:MAG: LytR C-terminal domain-containing protein [SAR324 cluster bacterium]
MGLALAACSRRPTAPAKPAAPTPEQGAVTQRAQEQKETERAAAERDARAKQAAEEAKRRQQAESEKLPPEFGTPSAIAGQGEQAPEPGGAPMGEGAAPATSNVQTVAPVYVPQKLPPPQVEGATPYDQSFPPIADRVVRVGIVSGTSQAASAKNVARMLTTEDRKYLEETLGLGVRIAYVSETNQPETGRTRVYYRPQFFKAAVQIAALLPRSQQVIAMSDAEALRHGVDVLVQVGTDLQ